MLSSSTYLLYICNPITGYIICLHTINGYEHMVIVIHQLLWSLTITEINSTLTALNDRIKHLHQSKSPSSFNPLIIINKMHSFRFGKMFPIELVPIKIVPPPVPETNG